MATTNDNDENDDEDVDVDVDIVPIMKAISDPYDEEKNISDCGYDNNKTSVNDRKSNQKRIKNSIEKEEEEEEEKRII